MPQNGLAAEVANIALLPSPRSKSQTKTVGLSTSTLGSAFHTQTAYLTVGTEVRLGGRTVRGSNPSTDKRFFSFLKPLDWLWGPPSLISNGHNCRVPGQERVGCEVYCSPPTSVEIVHVPRLKELRTVRIIALGILNLDYRRGVWLASVIGRSPREEKVLVTRGVGGWVDVLEERKVCLPPGIGPLLLVLS